MALRVAPCPRCNSALVFGERRCRGCGQTFDYGAAAPPEPSPAQVHEALVAAGVIAPPSQAQAQRPGAAAQAAPPSTRPPDGVDTGRFDTPARVQTQDVPGLMDSSLFGAFTPDHVDAPPVAGIERGRFEDAAIGAVAPVPGVEPTMRGAIEVDVPQISGIFHSDFLRAPDGVVADRMEGLEPSGSTPRPTPSSSATPAAQRKRDTDRGVVVCRCGEKHRLPRCPACGTLHPAETG